MELTEHDNTTWYNCHRRFTWTPVHVCHYSRFALLLNWAIRQPPAGIVFHRNITQVSAETPITKNEETDMTVSPDDSKCLLENIRQQLERFRFVWLKDRYQKKAEFNVYFVPAAEKSSGRMFARGNSIVKRNWRLFIVLSPRQSFLLSYWLIDWLLYIFIDADDLFLSNYSERHLSSAHYTTPSAIRYTLSSLRARPDWRILTRIPAEDPYGILCEDAFHIPGYTQG